MTFVSAQNPDWPPLPFNPFPEAKVVPIGDGVYVYDDMDVDYGKMQSAESLYGPSGLDGLEGVFDYGTNTYISSIQVSGNNVHLTLTNTLPGTPYDIYFTPNLEPGFWWRLHFRGATNQTEFNVTRPPTD